MSRLKERFESKILKTDSCWLWTAGLFQNGYGKFSINGENRGAHRVSHELYKGPIPNGLYVCHSCDNPKCVNPEHLWLGTAQENSIDRDVKGRRTILQFQKPMYGEKNGMAKLSQNDVIEIKYLLKCGSTLKTIAEKFNISYQHVSDIKLGKKWKHL